MSHDIYLDANATSQVLPAAADAALDAMRDCFGNPSSSHATGLRAKALLDAARARARRVLGAGPGRVLFTSGATEGIQTAVLSALCAVRERRAAGEDVGELLLVGATEHKAVFESLAHWNRLLGTCLAVRTLPVDGDGRHRLDVLRELAPRAAMVCTMAANNETGVISDLDGIADVLREHAPHAYWMVDCVQALGKLPLGLAATRIDYAPFSGHKLYAPKGIGLLYVRDGAPWTPLMIGGGQEGGQRSGTENMAGIAAFGAVLAALEEGGTFRSHDELVRMRARLADSLREAFPGIVFNAPFASSLPTTLNFAVPGLPAKELLDLFDAAGVRVSAGSACSAAKAAPSYVLEAMGLPLWRSSGAVRLSFGPLATEEFILEACARIRRCGKALRAAAPVSAGGVQQLTGEGRIGWIVSARDGEKPRCVVIDPPQEQAGRIAGRLRAAGAEVAAVLGSGADPHGEKARAALREALDLAPQDPGPLGWPEGVESIALGADSLRRLMHPDAGRAGYLLGERLAFIGDLGAPGDHPALREAAADTILCHALEVQGAPFSALREAVTGEGPAILEPAALARFLDEHPDALLVDVREAFEAAAGAMQLHGRAALALPLSTLAGQLDRLLAETRPLLFVCRSGNRSARAAWCLQRMGHRHSWSLAGGIALAGA